MSNYKASVYKEDKNNKNSTYRVSYTYISPDGKKHRTCKRGFAKKKEALLWVENVLPAIIREKEAIRTPDEMMTMGELIEEYLEDFRIRYKENTYQNKIYLINSKILPYLSTKIVHKIEQSDIRKWQKQLLSKGKDIYSPQYLRTIENQLTAILNYAIAYHDLPKNPFPSKMKIGKKISAEKTIWTPEEYKQFIKEIEYDPVYHCAFQVLFWGGLRRGEMMALTPADIDFTNNTIRVNKSYQRIKGKDVITTPKTLSSIRTISIPDELAQELKEYFEAFYNIDENARIFPVNRNTLYRKMKKGTEDANLKKITLHGLRHSNISMIANMGYSSVDIAYRAGHSKTSMTAHYTHRYVGTDQKIADSLNEKMTGGD